VNILRRFLLLAAVVVPISLMSCTLRQNAPPTLAGNSNETQITGIQAGALSSAVKAFKENPHIPSRYKDLDNYDFTVTRAGTIVYVEFMPHRAPNEKLEIGCCTSLGMQISYEVDIRGYRVVGYGIYE
jgi:hypothetical protein